MRTIGLLGGMSWESTVSYYQIINREIASRLGGYHSAEILMHSFDFQTITGFMHADDWDGLADHVLAAAKNLAAAGADCLLICTNTVHNVAERIEPHLPIPLLHIADAAGQALNDAGHHTAALLGTRFTMELDFYRKRLADHYAVTTITPDQPTRNELDRIIFQELVHGQLLPTSRATFARTIHSLAASGAQAAILGCTEIPLLITQTDSPIPLLDTTRLHALAAVRFALGS